MATVGVCSSIGALNVLSLELLSRMVGELGNRDRGRARQACRALASLCRTTSLALKGTTSADEFEKLVGWWNARGPHHAIPASLEWLSLDNCWRLEKLPEGSSESSPTLPLNCPALDARPVGTPTPLLALSSTSIATTLHTRSTHTLRRLRAVEKSREARPLQLQATPGPP